MTGDDLRALRHGYDLTQKQLAERLGVNHATVSRWEARGDEALPRRVVILVRAIERNLSDEKRRQPES